MKISIILLLFLRSGESKNVEISTSKSCLVLADYYETNFQALVDMGYARDEVEKALTETLNDPDRAIEYLINVSIYFII